MFISYLLPPPIFIGYYIWQERRARQRGVQRQTEPLPPDARTALIQWGGLLVSVAIALFLFPDLLIAAAPWKMTALTARALLSWFIGLGALMLSIAHENDRTQGLIAVPALLLVFPMVTIKIARFAG